MEEEYPTITLLELQLEKLLKQGYRPDKYENITNIKDVKANSI